MWLGKGSKFLKIPWGSIHHCIHGGGCILQEHCLCLSGFSYGFYGFFRHYKKGNIWGERYEFQSSNGWIFGLEPPWCMVFLKLTLSIMRCFSSKRMCFGWQCSTTQVVKEWAVGRAKPGIVGLRGLNRYRRDGTKRASWSHVAKTYNKGECHPCMPCSTTKCIVRWSIPLKSFLGWRWGLIPGQTEK